MGLSLNYTRGQTLLNEEAKKGLKIKSISSQAELNEFEYENIDKALIWLKVQKINIDRFLSEKFIKDLHFRMFNNVWSWAGKLRLSSTNIGIRPKWIGVEIKKLLNDVRYWMDNEVFSQEEIAIRLKHRLVFIHPFPNGNGRHSRLMADIFMEKIFHKDIFSWGGLGLHSINDVNSTYIKALHEADRGDYTSLLKFAKSKNNLNS